MRLFSGNEEDKQNIQKVVSCEILKEKLEKLVKQSKNHKKVEEMEKDVKFMLSSKKQAWESTFPESQAKRDLSRTESCAEKSITTNEAQIQVDIQSPIDSHNISVPSQTDTYAYLKDAKSVTVKRSDSWQGSSKYSRAKQMQPRHFELQTAKIKQLDQGVKSDSNCKQTAKCETETVHTAEKHSNEGPWAVPVNSPVCGEISRNDPKRITRRHIPRKKPLPNENGQEYEKLNLLPPSEFRDDAPPPPEAFRDPPEPIDNILYYVVESVNENREANRKREKEEKENAKRDYVQK